MVNLIDARLAEEQTDGWHYHDMSEDSQAGRDTLAALGSPVELIALFQMSRRVSASPRRMSASARVAA